MIALVLPLFLFGQDNASPFFEGTLEFEMDMNGPEADIIKANEPNKKMQMHIKDGSYIVNLMGGRYPKSFIFVSDSNYEYSMDMAGRRAFRLSAFSDQNRTEKVRPQAKPVGETREVNGILCDVYRMEHDNTLFFYYVNDAYRVNTALYEKKNRAQASFLVGGLEGRIPLKTIKKQEGLTVTTTLTRVTPREFDREQFLIPKDFDVKMRDYRY
jgi:hypothetical protein